MERIKVSDSNSGEDGITYLLKSLAPLASDLGGQIERLKPTQRTGFKVLCKSDRADFFRSEIEDKIADVLAIKYKYEFFKRKIRPVGLSKYETELLLTALISADIEDDKRYILRRLRGQYEYVLDGIFNFKLKPLKNKWKEVVSYIPIVFSGKQLEEFVAYLVSEKRGKKVLVQNGKVYDLYYNLLKRSSLLDGKGDVVREVLLSCGAGVEVLGQISKEEEKYLRLFFGCKVSFLKGSLKNG
ncbi:MAG: hypothetical protein IJW64_00935 [Clostridia bacterium]|nr:hypothetical protein [Clostridia bacterium]